MLSQEATGGCPPVKQGSAPRKGTESGKSRAERGGSNPQETAVHSWKEKAAQGETRAGRGMEITLEAFDVDIVGFSLLAKC